MNCQELRRVLGGVLEGEVAPEALAHLSTCRRCRGLVDDLGAITRTAGRLPEHEPSPGLWRRIRGAAEEEGTFETSWMSLLGRRPGLLRPVSLTPVFAATLVLLLVVGVVLVGYPELELTPVPEVPANPFEVARGELVLTPGYEERYAKHLDAIEATLREEVASADTELVLVAEKNLEKLDDFIQQCHVRLASYPEDEFTRNELNRLYQQKNTLLQAMLDPDWYSSVR